MANIWGHFSTITRHRHKVIAHCAKAGILWQGLRHDLSKYTFSEFFSGAKHYSDGGRSPNERERELLGYSNAWLHHKGRNKHHFEYWTDYDPVERKICPVKMPMNYVAEMFCDRVAASKIYQKDNYNSRHPLEYFEKGKNHRFIHPETSELLESWLTMLAEEGEKVTFRHIRQRLKNEKERINKKGR